MLLKTKGHAARGQGCGFFHRGFGDGGLCGGIRLGHGDGGCVDLCRNDGRSRLCFSRCFCRIGGGVERGRSLARDIFAAEIDGGIGLGVAELHRGLDRLGESGRAEGLKAPRDDEPADDDDDPVDTVPVALEQISEAKEDLREATWDSGNVLAGLAAMLPQMYLSGASASLERWQLNHALLQQRYAETYDDPFAHWLAGARIENSIQRTIRVQDQLEAAEKLLTVVGWFGAASQMEAIGQLIGTAADNGLVYQVVKMELQYNGNNPVRTEPVIYLSINGGEPAPVLVDTGSLGLIIDPRWVGVDNVDESTGYGWASYGDGSSEFLWESYDLPIGLDGVESSATEVLVVALQSVQGFTEYNGDYAGVFGIGANAGSPGSTNPFLAMPGMLSRGVLFDERRRRLILGPNPYGARTTIPGAPSSQLQVQIGDGEMTLVDTWVDSGGILGSVPDNVYGEGPEVPPGTVISVYTEDGETLLYSYTTTRKNTLSVNDSEDDPRFNTGFTPFSLGTLYFSFAGEGTTSFNY